LPIVAPVTLAGVVLFAAALWSLTAGGPSLRLLGGVLALLVAAIVCEAFPVPVEGFPGAVSLAATFVVGTALIYGWAPAVVVGFLTRALVDGANRRPAIRLAYNSAVYSLSAAATAAAAGPLASRSEIGPLLLAVLLGSLAFYAVNIPFVTAAIARAGRHSLLPFLRTVVCWTALPFAIMASLTLLLVAVWPRSPLLAAGLLGPLAAASLYQRSVNRALKATRLALTDPLTGLGNQRHFQDCLQKELDRSEAEGTPLSLCLIDLDDFKRINDRYGHPVGDRVLGQAAAHLRREGEAFRLGGDEFAVLLAGKDGREARSLAKVIVDRLAAVEYEHGGLVSSSVGVATFPEAGVQRSELVRVADIALYWAKAEGKSRVRVYRPDMGMVRQLMREPDRAARLRAAATLAKAVDARDAYTGRHSQRVAELAARIGSRLDLEPEQIELIRVAGSLHDLGKLAIPQELLCKSGQLSAVERRLLERHPEIGFQMLEPLEVEPVASWVLHHHERWDGGGYPGGLAGEHIPLAARILFVADAYDAMTDDRIYRPKLSRTDTLEELKEHAGTQFDPSVVAALIEELEGPARLAPVPLERQDEPRLRVVGMSA